MCCFFKWSLFFKFCARQIPTTKQTSRQKIIVMIFAVSGGFARRKASFEIFTNELVAAWLYLTCEIIRHFVAHFTLLFPHVLMMSSKERRSVARTAEDASCRTSEMTNRGRRSYPRRRETRVDLERGRTSRRTWKPQSASHFIFDNFPLNNHQTQRL